MGTVDTEALGPLVATVLIFHMGHEGSHAVAICVNNATDGDSLLVAKVKGNSDLIRTLTVKTISTRH